MLSQSHANKRILWIACSLVAAYALIAGAIYLVGRHIERDDNAAADTAYSYAQQKWPTLCK